MRSLLLVALVGCGDHHTALSDAPVDVDIDAACTTTLTVATTGDDTADGITGSVRTVTHALALAATAPCPAVTIEVGAGLFAESTGEVFPLATARTGITITGAGMANTTLRNPSRTVPAITLDHGLALAQLRVFAYMPSATPVSVLLHAVGDGHLTGVELDGNNQARALMLDAGSHVVVDGGTTFINVATNDVRGILDISDSTIDGTTIVGDGGVLHAHHITCAIVGADAFQFNDLSATNDTSTFDDATLKAAFAISILGNSRVKLRNSHLVGNEEGGILLLSASAQLDLGTLADPGNNVLNASTNRNSGVGICNNTQTTLVAVGNTFATCPPLVTNDCASGLGDVTANVQTPNCTAQ